MVLPLRWGWLEGTPLLSPSLCQRGAVGQIRLDQGTDPENHL